MGEKVGELAVGLYDQRPHDRNVIGQRDTGVAVAEAQRNPIRVAFGGQVNQLDPGALEPLDAGRRRHPESALSRRRAML
jgi:hypothetical protein